MKMKKVLCALAAALASCSPGPEAKQSKGASAEVNTQAAATEDVRDGPFGLAIGQPISEVKTKEIEPGIFQVTSVPKPHSDFEYVVAQAYSSTGICAIRGVGKPLQNDSDGSGVRGEVKELAEALASKYGQGQSIDQCNAGDVECEDQFWMMTLSEGGRNFGYGWIKPTSEMKKAGIETISLLAQADNYTTSRVLVEYMSESKACVAARKSSKASGL